MRWLFVVLTGCLILLAVGSLKWRLAWIDDPPDNYFAIAHGAVWVIVEHDPSVGYFALTHTHTGWIVEDLPGAWSTVAYKWWTVGAWFSFEDMAGRYYAAAVPLWVFIIPTAVFAGFLWRRERPVQPGRCCQGCGCSLTGNVSGRCPECGIPVGAAGESPRWRSWTRRVLMWTFTGASTLILLTWACSLPLRFAFPMGTTFVFVDHGHVHMEWRCTTIPEYSGAERWGFGLPVFKAQRARSFIRVPLWCPLLVTIIPTIVLWWIDRRRHPTGQ
ncbi:MAG: hypothetical protein PVJ57_21550 [Phycisphaerae bacterium]|jgi:hypothetical protein